MLGARTEPVSGGFLPTRVLLFSQASRPGVVRGLLQANPAERCSRAGSQGHPMGGLSPPGCSPDCCQRHRSWGGKAKEQQRPKHRGEQGTRNRGLKMGGEVQWEEEPERGAALIPGDGGAQALRGHRQLCLLREERNLPRG